MGQLTAREKRDWIVGHYIGTLNPKSKFFDRDVTLFTIRLNGKSEKEIHEIYARQKAISETTQREIDTHCQFDGLRKI